ncbi:MAG: ATP-binding cassette domain-containing protein [Peptoniphilus duerdenii]|uniref:ABC transporter ATP-binding protein n=1 Tax=Peptoniphilus duerdenii TaxID=507750 RepID=UPI00254B4C71|nr:ATP-binding cassette domain-containing protein [Peptoniphilus duerdenii]MDK8276250.1 ATP-binding cassette domain-containing protein [Peptoniphilus duerdenii]
MSDALNTKNNIVTLKDAELSFRLGKNKNIKVLDKLNLEIENGKVLGLVGESGCGKTTVTRVLLGLESLSNGTYTFLNREIKSRSDFSFVRQNMQMVFQDPFLSIDPTMRMKDVLEEPMLGLRKEWDKKTREKKILKLIELVGLDRSYLNYKSKEMSGGQRQRIGIARALITEPKVLLCDECVSALDISIQAQILNLLIKIKNELEFTIVFISHDLAVVKYIADEIAVMKDGKICEKRSSEDLFKNPESEHTKYLIESALL